MMSRTKGKLECGGEEDTHRAVVSSADNYVCAVPEEDTQPDWSPESMEEDVAHAVACWNLVEDFATPADIRAVLEAVGVWRDVRNNCSDVAEYISTATNLVEKYDALRKPAEEESRTMTIAEGRAQVLQHTAAMEKRREATAEREAEEED